jgi:hypothetical protein
MSRAAAHDCFETLPRLSVQFRTAPACRVVRYATPAGVLAPGWTYAAVSALALVRMDA